MNLIEEKINNPEELNFILGQSHFIKTIEDICEIIITSIPNAQFGIAFNEASGPCLIRRGGTNKELEDLAVENMKRLAAGHTFIVFMRDFFPISVLNQIQSCQEVVNIFCATANPVSVALVENSQGRGIIGVIDGYSPKGVENEEDIQKRKDFLRMIGYKK